MSRSDRALSAHIAKSLEITVVKWEWKTELTGRKLPEGSHNAVGEP